MDLRKRYIDEKIQQISYLDFLLSARYNIQRLDITNPPLKTHVKARNAGEMPLSGGNRVLSQALCLIFLQMGNTMGNLGKSLGKNGGAT